MLKAKRHPLFLIGILGIFLTPQHALANAGTPLMWAGMLHLLFGNALIGLLEGVLLAWCSSLPKRKCISVMVLANYTSAWVGGYFIRSAIVRALPMDLSNGWRWFWLMVVATYCMTFILELPFVFWCLRGTQGWMRRSMRASFVVQSVSYIVLFGWYWMASGTSLYTKMQVVAPAQISLPEPVFVYFIAPTDGHVYCRRLTGGPERKVCDLRSKNTDDKLFVRLSKSDTTRWDLVARLETKDRREPVFATVLTNLAIEAAPDWRSTHADPPQYEGTWFSFGKVEGLASGTNSSWEFWAGFWPIEGLRGTNRRTGEQVRFSYETPFGAWTVRNAVHLPSDKVLFQLGRDQICAFDPVNRRVALLWRGRGPVAIIEKTNALGLAPGTQSMR